MFTAEDLQAKFQGQMGMQPTPSSPQTSAEGSMQNMPNPNMEPNSGATPTPVYGDATSDGTEFANQFKMNVADRLVPVEDDGSIRSSSMR